jgi:hypothetical protein
MPVVWLEIYRNKLEYIVIGRNRAIYRLCALTLNYNLEVKFWIAK